MLITERKQSRSDFQNLPDLHIRPLMLTSANSLPALFTFVLTAFGFFPMLQFHEIFFRYRPL